LHKPAGGRAVAGSNPVSPIVSKRFDAARNILGTKSLTDTVDAALEEVVKVRDRQRLVALLFEPGALELDDPAAMAGAWR
jgi:hypothetical protein